MFNPQYKLNSKILNMLMIIAEAKVVIERAKILPKQELKLRRQALVRMTHSSTAIEGNMLNIHQVEDLAVNKKVDAPARDIYEVENYLKAIKYIEQLVRKNQFISQRILLRIHRLVTQKTLLEKQSGHYRQGPIYVVRQRLGFPQETIYTGPEAKKVPKLCADLIGWIKKSEQKEVNPIVVAGIVHQEIAAIHPFSDGNGRTARAIATLILYQRGYDFRHLFALEDYYNKDRQKYYQAINVGKNYNERRIDFTPWLEYFIKGFKEEINSVRTRVLSLVLKKFDGSLKQQIYLDNELVQVLDFLDQVEKITVKDVVDILKCPRRTAQLRLSKLKKLKMIKQIGKGPSSAYLLK